MNQGLEDIWVCPLSQTGACLPYHQKGKHLPKLLHHSVNYISARTGVLSNHSFSTKWKILTLQDSNELHVPYSLLDQVPYTLLELSFSVFIKIILQWDFSDWESLNSCLDVLVLTTVHYLTHDRQCNVLERRRNRRHPMSNVLCSTQLKKLCTPWLTPHISDLFLSNVDDGLLWKWMRTLWASQTY